MNALVLAVVLSGSTASDNRQHFYPPVGWMLVMGRCVNTREIGSLSNESNFEICEVIIGHPGVNTLHFSVRYLRPNLYVLLNSLGEDLMTPTFKKHDLGYFWVRYSATHKIQAIEYTWDIQRVVPDETIFHFPLATEQSRLSSPPEKYPSAEVMSEWVNAMRDLSKAKSRPDAMKLIDRFSRSPHKPIRDWAKHISTTLR